METITLDKRECDRLTCKLATQETELKHAQKLLEAPAQVCRRRRFWGLGSNVIAAALVVGFLNGCVPTVTDIRNSNPVRMMSSPKPPQKVANCVSYETQAEAGTLTQYWHLVNMTERDGIYNLAVVRNTLISLTVMGELTVRPDGQGGSLIEYRCVSIVQGGIDRFWDYVKKCADKSPASGQ